MASEYGDPETQSWSRGNKSTLMVERGELAGALALARRNCELTDQLGDVFSRTLALISLGYVQIAVGDPEAVATIELSDRTYREAMKVGGEGEAWRRTLLARAMLANDRVEEALEQAEAAASVSRERGMLWQLPAALHVLAQSRAAAGAAGVEEALEEATEICERLDHRMTLRKIDADRQELLSAAASA
jgi:hypothetical protein